MGMWIHCWPFGCAFDPDIFNSWVAGALDSAWRAVDNYLALNHPEEVREKFWKLWGPTEYWDEDPELIKLHRELLDQHLAITLHEAGILVG